MICIDSANRFKRRYPLGSGALRRRSILVFRTLCLCLVSSGAFAAGSNGLPVSRNALPVAGKVVAGQATISQSNNTLTVNQSSQKAVINWDSFNVGANATVNFNQPNSGASTLNRVNGASESLINGALNSNGQVILVNPNGVVFGKGAEVNTGGIVATTMDIKDADYLNGNMAFSGNGRGKVVNKGRITVNNIDGYIALMAPEVRNEGVLTATLSSKNVIALAAGEKVTIYVDGGQLAGLSVDASAVKTLIANKHLIQVGGGQVVLAANALSDLRASVVNNTGVISATGIDRSGGKISLTASTVNQSGTLSANSNSADGGQIALTGDKVLLADGSKTTATGFLNGGTINVGTTDVTYTQNADGSRSNVQARNLAKTVTVAAGASVDVSSIGKGNGGQINVWSSEQTNVAGNFSASGGALGGNGGSVETSSLGKLVVAATTVVNTSAPAGQKGSWMLDPDGLTIDSSTATALSSALTNANVTVAVQGDLTVAAGAAVSVVGAATNTTLTLNASGAITNNGSVALGQNSSLVINAASLTLSSGSVTSANQVTATAQSISSSGSITSTGGSTGGINLLANSVVIAGNISSSGSGSSSGTGSTTGSSSGSSGSSGSGSSGSSNSGSSGSGSSSGTGSTSTSSSSSQSNTVSGKSSSGAAASVTPSSAAQLLSAIVSAQAAAAANLATAAAASTSLAASTKVVNMTASNMASSLVSAINSASQAAALGATTYINVASGSVAGSIQPAMNIVIAPNSGAIGLAPTAVALASGGSVNVQAAQNLTVTANSTIAANAATVSAPSSSSGSATSSSSPTASPAAGSVSLIAYSGPAIIAGTVSANSSSGQGGVVAVAANDVSFNSALIQANGTTGGSVYVTATSGSAKMSNTTVAANGTGSGGGTIQIAGQNETQLVASSITANGITTGGGIQIGINNSIGSGSTLAPPALVAFANSHNVSNSTTLDSQTLISANAQPSSLAVSTLSSSTGNNPSVMQIM